MIRAPSDPTAQLPAGPPDDATGTWHVSLGEIDALGRKAARGAGFAWGLAEEAGRAARWLAAYRLPGPETLLATLEALDGGVARHAPRPEGDAWDSPAGLLCPVATGAALSDRAHAIRDGARVRLGPVLFPLLILPPLCRAARDLGFPIGIASGDVAAVAMPDGPAARDFSPFGAARVEGLSVAGAETAPAAALLPCADAHAVDVDVWRRLDRFAHRTYVPATESSRRGAGAGLRDAD